MTHLCLSASKSTDDFSELSFRISELAREPRVPRQQREDGSGEQGSLPKRVKGECGPGSPSCLLTLALALQAMETWSRLTSLTAMFWGKMKSEMQLR